MTTYSTIPIWETTSPLGYFVISLLIIAIKHYLDVKEHEYLRRQLGLLWRGENEKKEE